MRKWKITTIAKEEGEPDRISTGVVESNVVPKVGEGWVKTKYPPIYITITEVEEVTDGMFLHE